MFILIALFIMFLPSSSEFLGCKGNEKKNEKEHKRENFSLKSSNIERL